MIDAYNDWDAASKGTVMTGLAVTAGVALTAAAAIKLVTSLAAVQKAMVALGLGVADLKRAADATKGQTKADRDYKNALADLRDANNAVSRSSKEKKKAQEAYDKVADKAKEATDRLKQAQEALADSARSVSDAFRETYLSKSTDVQAYLQLMKDGAADLTAFSAQIAQLRRLGLNESTVQQVISIQQQNPQAGADLAAQIAAGGKGIVDQLNSATTALQAAADNLGYLSATGIQRHAGGGLVVGRGTGTSDSVLTRQSTGEYDMQTAAVNHYGLGFMQDVNRLRYQPAGTGPVAAAAGTVDRSNHTTVAFNAPVGGDPYAIARSISNRMRDEMTAAGLSIGLGG